MVQTVQMCEVKLSRAAKASDVCICPLPRSKSKYDGEHLIFPWQDSSPTKVSKNHLPESIQILWIRPKDRGTNTKATNNKRYHINDLNYLIGGENNTLKRTWKTRRYVLQSSKRSFTPLASQMQTSDCLAQSCHLVAVSTAVSGSASAAAEAIESAAAKGVLREVLKQPLLKNIGGWTCFCSEISENTMFLEDWPRTISTWHVRIGCAPKNCISMRKNLQSS